MFIKKVAAFMLTDTGKKVSYITAAALSSGALCASYLPHTLLLGEYKKLVQLYKNGLSVPLTKEIESRFQKVLEILEIDPVDRHLYKPFHVVGFDVMSAGSSFSKDGVIIGLPINFSYDNPSTIDRTKMRINHETIIWETEPAQNLLKSLVLSENAQLYAMAREVLHRQTPKPLIDTALNANLVISTYAICRTLNEKFNLYDRPLSLRFGMYSLVALFSIGFYVMLKDVTQVYYEDKVDKELKKKNKIFLEGGKEFYSKLLERNKALRQLLGKEGETLYSVLGNENSLFRNKHIPLVQRLSAFESKA
ncbi:transmembrane protein 177 isoform X1 [Diabrotica virgifera virgifera]|uniref:Transmembrane protein 177 n=1 Tax=Diabrotica virgifera virgifera TaxID=50390 RepID=A0ABM5IV09_DIAVI|nr:transmembrane protein 177 isoform X1 [Diabrotica virgifera virgifera]